MKHLALLLPLAALLVTGCRSPNTGSHTVVGEQTILPEVTSPGQEAALRIYESIKGADVWTAKNAIVKIEYSNTYTNSYFGIVSTQDTMKLKVSINPCGESPDAETLRPSAPPREESTPATPETTSL